jgi:hypothetical protein
MQEMYAIKKLGKCTWYECCLRDQIDEAVYRLYELTEEEIKVAEGKHE